MGEKNVRPAALTLSGKKNTACCGEIFALTIRRGQQRANSTRSLPAGIVVVVKVVVGVDGWWWVVVVVKN